MAFENYHTNTGSSFVYENIAPTAWPVAYCRTLTDIPYAKEIYKELEKKAKRKHTVLMDNKVNANLIAPRIEARYKLIDRMLAENKAQQIFEIASGVSPRGYLASEDAQMKYVEMDLPAMMKEKRKIIESLRLMDMKEKQANLYLEEGNAINPLDVASATSYFDENKSVAVVTEGLLRYLTMEEKTIVAENILTVLKKFGGVWITPDISSMILFDAKDKKAQETIEEISRTSGRDTSKNFFTSIDDVKTFFENIGFEVEIHTFMEVAHELVSPKKLGLAEAAVVEKIENGRVFVMRAKK